MKIWLVRHGQTKLNKQKVMQGHTDEPLNDVGIEQAKAARQRIENVKFDAVYASPLGRAVTTGAIVGGVEKKDVLIDERLIEVSFGPYEMHKYYLLGPAMTLYWALPEVFPAPKGVEPLKSIVERSSSFLKELEQKNYENVLVASHGGVLRGLNGYLSDRKSGVVWRPKMHNCEIRVYESEHGKHRLLEKIIP